MENLRLIPNGISFFFKQALIMEYAAVGKTNGAITFNATGEVYRDDTYCCDCYNLDFGLRLLE